MSDSLWLRIIRCGELKLFADDKRINGLKCNSVANACFFSTSQRSRNT